uniref:Copper transport protein n=1 Tax=Oryzias latipes TaxID=8090 RepID=A0A3P9ICZ6_ORYLA
MRMTFGVFSSVTLLFDFWDVHSPAGMVLSVLLVLLLALFYEVLKVWRVWLSGSQLAVRAPACTPPPSVHSESASMLEGSPETSLAPVELHTSGPNSWLLHVIQTALHVLQVVLGYMLMLCVMSYNTWIFLGVVLGSVLGYFLSFPLLDQMQSFRLV